MVAKLYSYELKTSWPKYPIRQGLILQWNDGWGEIAPLPGLSSETLEEAKSEILSLLPDLASARPRHPSVRFGLAAASKPFSEKPLKIPLALVNDPRPGFSTLKLKLRGMSIEEAVVHVKKFLGRYRLRLDCNRSWTLDEALSFTRHFSPQDFEYLEDPVQTFDELVRFSKLSGFPIAVDELVLYCAREGFLNLGASETKPNRSEAVRPTKEISEGNISEEEDRFGEVAARPNFKKPTVRSMQLPCHEIPTLKAAVIKPSIIGFFPSLPVPTVLSSALESSLGLLQIARCYENGTPPAGLDTFRFFPEDLLVPPLKAEGGFLTWAGSASPIDMTKLCPVH